MDCYLLTIKGEGACAHAIDLAHDVSGQQVGASLRVLYTVHQNVSTRSIALQGMRTRLPG